MVKLTLALALLFALAGAYDDTWISPDKGLHIAGAALSTGGLYALARVCHVQHRPALWTALGVTAAACMGKEVYDWRWGKCERRTPNDEC